MTETVPNKIFDVACPNPLKLQEISSLAIVEELLRRRIRLYLEQPIGRSVYYLISGIVLEDMLPNMPRRIYDCLNKYITRERNAIGDWLRDHMFKVFKTDYEGCVEILSMFDDFALDWNGTIHQVRTAKRMLLCDRIGIDVKFRIACLYCLEDDIKRIWPSVSSTIQPHDSCVYLHTEVYYWTRFLRNEPFEIPDGAYYIDEPIDEMMLYGGALKMNYSCALFFWNRIPLERQSHSVIRIMSDTVPKLFARFILPKLNEQQLEEFIRQRGKHLIRTQLMSNERKDRDLVLPILSKFKAVKFHCLAVTTFCLFKAVVFFTAKQ
ncbi:uncharacterized protein LOC135842680 [Planococcus citri]|uniref:uncharacterized protein LOC135842680 n=1 Tax=Planococcus citri TaxID=170843 RepID=UPI0031F99123